MVSTRVAIVEEIARYFAEIVRTETAIRQVWIRQDGEVAELWVITEPINSEPETRLRVVRQRIQEKFPTTRFTVRLLNLRLSDSPDLSFLVPRDAKLFTMH